MAISLKRTLNTEFNADYGYHGWVVYMIDGWMDSSTDILRERTDTDRWTDA